MVLQGVPQEAGEIPVPTTHKQDPTKVITQPQKQHMETVFVIIKQPRYAYNDRIGYE
jgi:hypothetical protein